MRAGTHDARTGVAAVDRAFAIIAAFRDGDRALSLAEIARRTGLYKSTILRLIESIASAGFLRQLDDGTYAIGSAALHLARLFQSSFDFDRALQPVLTRLAKDTGETASFYVRDRDRRVCVRRVEPDRAVRIVLHEGDRLPLEVGSAGKLLVAYTRPGARADADVREAMVAVSRGERDPDVGSVSVPVFARGGTLAGALSLSGPIDRFDATTARVLADRLLDAAAALTQQIGGDPAPLHRARTRAAAKTRRTARA